MLMLYSALMVAFVGRTCGMMVYDMRVARRNNSAPGPLLAVWRYLLALITCVTIIPCIVGALSGWRLHERLSGTRLVRGAAPRADA